METNERRVAFVDVRDESVEPQHAPSAWSLVNIVEKWLAARRTSSEQFPVPSPSTRHRWSTKSEKPGLHIAVLVDIFGEGMKSLKSLEMITVTNSNGGVLKNEDGMKWTRQNINSLIDMFNERAISEKDTRKQQTLIHHAIVSGALECAKILFDYASQENLVVDLCWSGGNILEWSISNYSAESVQFVMERMTSRCASVKQTVEVMTNHLVKLIKTFPAIAEKFITQDHLCFEYGRFQVPKSIFNGADERPIGMTVDHEHEEPKWEAEDTEEVQSFWETRCPEVQKSLRQREDEEQVTAVSKFSCIEDLAVDDNQRAIATAAGTKCSVEVFRSEAIRAIVQWKWRTHIRRSFQFSNVMYLISVLCFFVFTNFYGDLHGVSASWIGDYKPGNNSERDVRVAQVAIFFSFCFLVIPLVVGPTAECKLLFEGGETCFFLLVHAFLADRHTVLSAVVVSVHCLIVMFKTLQYLRPFRWFGPFVAMTYYVLRDILPFMFMGAIVVINFGVGLFVLLGKSFQQHDELRKGRRGHSNDDLLADEDSHLRRQVEKEIIEDMIETYVRSFRTIWRVFEYLLHAIVGQFEPDVFHLSRNSFLAAWINVFFSVFLLLAAIVLLSLLISVLGNTFDRVVLHEEAEFIKYRAQCIGDFDRINLRRRRYWAWIRAAFCCKCGSTEPRKYRYLDGRLRPVRSLCLFHYLVPAEKAVVRNETAWHGRIHAVIKSTRNTLQEQGEKDRKERENLRSDIEGIKSQIDDLRRDFNEHTASVNKALQDLLHRLPGGSHNS